MSGRLRPISDDLVARVRAGDERAYETVVMHYAGDLSRFAVLVLGGAEDTEDVVQDAFVQAWLHRTTLPAADGIQAYLYRVTRNRAIDVLRHRRTMDAYAADVLADENAEFVDDGEHAVRDDLEHAKLVLTDRQRQVLMLRYEQGNTHAEVAHILGVSLRAAEQLAKRALSILRNELRR